MQKRHDDTTVCDTRESRGLEGLRFTPLGQHCRAVGLPRGVPDPRLLGPTILSSAQVNVHLGALLIS